MLSTSAHAGAGRRRARCGDTVQGDTVQAACDTSGRQAGHGGGTRSTGGSQGHPAGGMAHTTPRHVGLGRASTALLPCTPSWGHSPRCHRCRMFPLHKHSFPSYTSRVLFLMQDYLFFFSRMWSSFVYLLGKIRKVPRERVFLHIPISYRELHY